MAYSPILKPNTLMNTKLYTGNGSTNNITGVGFQPDWVWTKCRSTVNSSRLIDAVRGVTKAIVSNSTGAEFTEANGLSAFGTDGYTLNGNLASMNTNNDTYVSWNWKAGGGQGSSNTDGSINTTYTSVNTTAGFSISQYTGTGSVGTIGHGLGAVPKMIITKPYSTTGQWYTYHASLGNTHYLDLVSTATASDDAEMWNDTSPTSSVFTVGVNGNTNGSGKTTIAYAFAEKTGYSKFGSYIGNGNANGAFVYTGFKPAFVMLKNTTTAASWLMYDNKRLGYNVDNNELVANTNAVEETYDQIDILSNGFKMRANGTSTNKSGDTFIYMAFAKEPLVASNYNVATAR